MKASLLVLDYTLYPRQAVDEVNVRNLVNALRSGVQLPPAVVDEASKRVIDGYHRVTAWRRVGGTDSDVPVEERAYASDAEMFLDAVRLNASHGRPLSPFDRARVLARAAEFSLTRERLAEALAMPLDRVEIVETRTAHTRAGEAFPLKSAVRHLAGSRLSARQVAAMPKVGGMSAQFCAGQLLNFLRGDLLDGADKALLARLRELYEALHKYARLEEGR